MAKTCPACAAQNPDDAGYCARCGRPYALTPVAPPAPARYPAQTRFPAGLVIGIVASLSLIGLVVAGIMTRGFGWWGPPGGITPLPTAPTTASPGGVGPGTTSARPSSPSGPVSGPVTAAATVPPAAAAAFYDPPEWERADGPGDVTVRAVLQPGPAMPVFTIEVYSLKEAYGYDLGSAGYKLKWLSVVDNTTGRRVLDTALESESFTTSGGLRFIDYTFDGYPDLCIQSYNDFGEKAYLPEVDGAYRSFRLFVWDPARGVFTENTDFATIPAPAAVPSLQAVYSHDSALVMTTQYDSYTKWVYANGRFTQTALLTVDMYAEIEPEIGEKLVYTEYDANGALAPVTFTRPPRSAEISGEAQKYYVPGSVWDLNSPAWICTMDLDR